MAAREGTAGALGVLRNFIAGVGAAIGAAIPGGDEPAAPPPDDRAVLEAAGPIAPVPYPNPLFVTVTVAADEPAEPEPAEADDADAEPEADPGTDEPADVAEEADAGPGVAAIGDAALAAAAPAPPADEGPPPQAAASQPTVDHIGPVAGILDNAVSHLDTALLSPAPPGEAGAFTASRSAADAFAPGGAFDALFGADPMAMVRGPRAAIAPVPLENPLGYREGADLILAALPPNEAAISSDRPDAACLSRLAGLQVAALAMPVIHEGSCGMDTPVEVASIGATDGIRFSPAAVIDCGVTAALSSWLLNVVRPAARDILRQDVIGIRVAASYACRGRNNDPFGVLSEHAFGNAIDISAFQLADGSWLAVKPEAQLDRDEAAFQRTIRDAACGPFKTVLGPGVALHDDHFHLDMAQRRNGSVYCR
ncbi:MAG: extensin family protein [Bauldia sp.]|nr:extensin family protein [Bauldia sp.]